MALGEGASVPEVRRRLAAGIGEHPPIEISDSGVRGWLRSARNDARLLAAVAPEAAVPSLADRIVVLLERELARLERAPSAKLDVDRLDRIARTLATVSKVERPKGEGKERDQASGLLRLLPEGNSQGTGTEETEPIGHDGP